MEDMKALRVTGGVTHTKASITKHIADAVGITKVEAEEAVNAFTKYILTIGENDKVELRGFGTFSRKYISCKGKHNPKTRASVYTEAYTNMRFKPSKMVRRAV
jgi:nucleoid DNA-binding protein